MDNGFVLLHRKMFSNKMWLSEKFTKAQAWVDLFANANHAPGSFYVRGNEVKIGRGQLGWSIENMAQRWRWNRKTVMRFLSVLEQGQQIGQQRTRLTTIITIVNYDKYQDKGTSKRTTRRTSDGTSGWTQTTMLNNVNNDIRERAPTQDTKNFFEGKETYVEYLDFFSKDKDRGVIENEFKKFILYWTESNGTGTKQRWQQQSVFDVKRRLVTWLGKVSSFSGATKQRIVL